LPKLQNGDLDFETMLVPENSEVRFVFYTLWQKLHMPDLNCSLIFSSPKFPQIT